MLCSISFVLHFTSCFCSSSSCIISSSSIPSPALLPSSLPSTSCSRRSFLELDPSNTRHELSFRPAHISANISAGRAQVASHNDHRHVFCKESVPFYLPNCTSVSLRWRAWDVRLLRRTRHKYTTTRTTHTTRNYPISRTPRSTIAGMDQPMDHPLTPRSCPNPYRHRRAPQRSRFGREGSYERMYQGRVYGQRPSLDAPLHVSRRQ